jgi:hypothetical protein
MNKQLTDLIDSIIATDESPKSWAWHADPDDDDSPYMDCSPCRSSYLWEVGDGYANTQLELTVEQLREIHRKLTIQLAVIARQQQA